MYRPAKQEIKEGWKKIHEEELYNFSSSPSSIRVIKSRRMKRAEEKFMHFLISNFRRVLYVVCFLLGNSLASDFICRRFGTLCSIFIGRQV
jgi:hypothetical protein